MLLAIQSTEVAEEHKDGRTAEKLVRGEDLAVQGEQVEVEVDRHGDIMLRRQHRNVIRITEEMGHSGLESRKHGGVHLSEAMTTTAAATATKRDANYVFFELTRSICT